MRITILVLVLSLSHSAFASTLGRISFPNSGAPEAQEPFLRGVLLLHSFEYEDAREAFREASAIDPSFALAYWGEAMTFNHPFWRFQDRDAALAALARFAPTPAERLARTPTDRERGFIAAIDTLYGEGDKVARDHAYRERMTELAARFPDDHEIRAFHALSILGSSQGDRDFATYMAAASIVEEIFDANPLHPGAVHYMIHSYDDPIHAPLGLRAARVYAKVAPDASHAQHMISHIYMALGRWAESVEANVNAVNVSVERRKRKNLGADAVSYHALHWLAYSYLQLGRWDDAKRQLDFMTRLASESGSGVALWHHAAMRATWLTETGMPGPDEIRTDEAHVTGRAASIFADGYSALRRGDRATAMKAAKRLEGALESTTATHCSISAGYRGVTENDLDTAGIMRTSLLAAIALDEGNEKKALTLIAEAAAAEDRMPLEYGPPSIVKPTHELWGEMLLKLKRPDEARAQFEKALARAPRRTKSLAGLAIASSALDDAKGLALACSELTSIYTGDAASRIPQVCGSESRPAVAGMSQ